LKEAALAVRAYVISIGKRVIATGLLGGDE
jgi:hypothetical protein